MLELPPLSLYVHIPWCLRKCPYCDFNSHEAKRPLDETGYVNALLVDLSEDLKEIGSRPLESIFIGGGTPSLFSPHAIGTLLEGIAERMDCPEETEVTMEANPGVLEPANFRGYRDVGVNRLSIGVQSFDPDCLKAIGRIHGPDEAYRSIDMAKQAGFDRINIDLMFGLPGQSLDVAKKDMALATELDPGHISFYQLTIEPNTAFGYAPPTLPAEESIWQIQQQGQRALAQAGYRQYEISAYAKTKHRCRHNLNYWTYGDYLGIGAGAHGKVTDSSGRIKRTAKWRHPGDYQVKSLNGAAVKKSWQPSKRELPLEFMMNVLRLHTGFTKEHFESRTGLPFTVVEDAIRDANARGLMAISTRYVGCTPLGRRFLNDLLTLFLPS